MAPRAAIAGGLDDCPFARRLAARRRSLHEKLVERLAKVAQRRPLRMAFMADSLEDRGFIDYLADCARQAGVAAYRLRLEDIGLRHGTFLDLSNRRIELLFKL
jgi:glutathionylspermidine synthase